MVAEGCLDNVEQKKGKKNTFPNLNSNHHPHLCFSYSADGKMKEKQRIKIEK